MDDKKDDIDGAFDKAEKVATRIIKLITIVVTGIAGISLAGYLAYDQLIDKHNDIQDKKEYFEETIDQPLDSIPLYE